MMKWIFATLLFSTVSANACPNLEGNFKYSVTSIISVSQAMDTDGITTYKVTIDDGNCAACHITQYLKADGLVKTKKSIDAEEVTKMYCENDRLKIRITKNYFDDGQIIETENIHQDYRINWQNNLALEFVENEIPTSKVVFPRIN
jgi:hypothetical protein